VDAVDENRFFTYDSAKTTIQQLAAGLRAVGVKKGDCVLIHSFNDVYPLVALQTTRICTY
jgi:non-ribosomal peptide synthetase component E (peptide arylation enzyme)